MNKSPIWLTGLIGASLAALTTSLGIAVDLFNPEIRCCLGIDPPSMCPPPPCLQKMKCFLGFASSGQCDSPPPSPSSPSRPAPSPLLNSQYQECKAHFAQFQCQGILTTDGQCYTGESRHQYQGQGFLLTYQGNKCYQGQFQAGQIHGNSLLLFKDGTIYQGEFRSGKRHGQGKMIAPDGTVIYEGQWNHDKPH